MSGEGGNRQEILASLQTRFSVVDYCVFAFLLAVSAVIGLYFGFRKKQKTTADFLMGGRSMGVFPMAMSLIASFMSAIALLGTPAETYQFGTMYWIIGISYILMTVSAMYWYFPVFYKMNAMSAYEYLDRRFNRFLRCLGSAIFSIQMTIYMAIVVYAPALALSQVTGMNVYLSVTLIFIVCIFYCVAGGMKAVMWTDTVQVLIMYAALVAVVLKGVFDIGGFGAVWEANQRTQRIEFNDFSMNPTVRHTWWSLVIGGYFTWIAIYGVNQAQVQRYLSVPSMAHTRKALWVNLVGLLCLVSICSYAGLVIFAKYQDCDPLKAKIVSTSDQLFPLFVMDTMGNFPGIPGVFVAGIFSGALSTVSSGLNSLAAITLEDFVKPFIFKNMTDARATQMSRILSLIFGILSFVLVFIAEKLGNVLQAALSIFGMIGGPLLGMFTLGMFFPWANSKGAIAGSIGGLIITFWIGTGAQIAKSSGLLGTPKKPVSTEGCVQLYSLEPSLQELFNTTLLQILAEEDQISASIVTATEAGFANEFITVSPKDQESMPLLGLYSISYMWYSAIGCISVIVIGMLVSWFTGFEDMRKMNPDLISPGAVSFMKLLPQSWRDAVGWHLGADYDQKSLHGVSSKDTMASKDSDVSGIIFGTNVSHEVYLKPDGFHGKFTQIKDESNDVPALTVSEYGDALIEARTLTKGTLSSDSSSISSESSRSEEREIDVAEETSDISPDKKQSDNSLLENLPIGDSTEEPASRTETEEQDDIIIVSSSTSSSTNSSLKNEGGATNPGFVPDQIVAKDT